MKALLTHRNRPTTTPSAERSVVPNAARGPNQFKGADLRPPSPHRFLRRLSVAGAPHPCLLPEWPAAVRRRHYMCFMPPSDRRSMGRSVLLWVQATFRVQDNLALYQAMWLASRLSLPLEAVVIVPPGVAELGSHYSSTRSESASTPPSAGTTAHATALCSLAMSLKRHHVPLYGVLGELQEGVDAIRQFVSSRRPHVIITDAMHGHGVNASIGHLLCPRGGPPSLPCPLAAIDSHHLIPVRLMEHLCPVPMPTTPAPGKPDQFVTAGDERPGTQVVENKNSPQQPSVLSTRSHLMACVREDSAFLRWRSSLQVRFFRINECPFCVVDSCLCLCVCTYACEGKCACTTVLRDLARHAAASLK